MKLIRLVIYPKDVQRITGRGPRYAQRLLRKIRQSVGKTEEQFVTIHEFCGFSGITVDELEEYLR